MAEVPLGIPRLLHRAKHQERNRTFLGLAVQLLEQPLKIPRPHGAGRRRKRVAESGNELLELLHFQGIGLLVDAVQARHPAPLDERRHGFVRQQHELFDQLVRDVPLGFHDRFNLACIVEDHFRLGQIEVNRPAPFPARVQHLEQLPHQLELRHEVAIFAPSARAA